MLKMLVKIVFVGFVFLSFFSCKDDETLDEEINVVTGTLTDVDGNTYGTVTIGKQIWMAENLRVTYYADGTPIDEIIDDAEWTALEDNNVDKAFCYYNNNLNGEKDIYGALYTYAAAVRCVTYDCDNVQGVCPDGWHIPSMADWLELIDFINDDDFAASKLKSKRYWDDVEDEVTNEYSFSAYPAGYRYLYDGKYKGLGRIVSWWSSEENTQYDAYTLTLYTGTPTVHTYNLYGKSYGLSVRCIKD